MDDAARIVTAAGRLAGASGLEPERRISFQWQGRRLAGYGGDTLASALLANGFQVLGRGFKYHRPRGVTSAGVEEAGAYVSTGRGARRTPNVNAAVEELHDGLEAWGQNAWPSVDFDLGRVNDLASPFFAAGFYYKTFFSLLPWGGRGTRDWMLYEKAIRRAAGMGRLAQEPDPDAYETVHAFCDALVVGSGPAGLAAAATLAEAGEDVVLAEQDFLLGGRLLSDGEELEGASPLDWRADRLRALTASGARLWSRTTAFGLYDHGVVGLVQKAAPGAGRGALRERLIILRAKRIVLATGATERRLVFADNDRPGILSASALRSYVGRLGVLPGRRIVIATTNDSAYADLDRLAAAGAETTVLDLRAEGGGATPEGVRRRVGAGPARARGRVGVEALDLAIRDGGSWQDADRIEADLIAVSGGWSPTLHLASQRGVKLVWDDDAQAHRASSLPAHETPIEIAGAAGLALTAASCAASGRNAALRLLGRPEEPAPPGTPARPPARIHSVETPKARGKAFIDLMHDVTLKDVRLAAREGFVSPEHLKRYTTLGMAPDQGKSSNLPGLAALAEARDLPLAELAATTFRPPFTPVSLGALAGGRHGRHVAPERRTPLHDWNLAQGAVTTDAGLWKRPWYYPQGAERLAEAYIREAATVRRTVGLCDVTSLGKIRVQGPDAAEFLNRVYVNGFAKLPVGRARYGVMLREDGMVFDDGTVWRLGEEDFLLTTTTAGAGKVMSWLEKLAETRWPELKIALASVTEAWAGMAVAGPLARRLLATCLRDIGFSDAAFPFMGVREGRFADVPCRVARISFSGELAYEVYVDADHGAALAAALWDHAEPWGGVLYGTESLGTLRIEKGHVAGAELDGRTTLQDLGLGAMASSKKAYVGQALSARPALADPDRARFVGLMPREGETPFSNGAILCPEDAISGHGVGWITSVTWSPALDAHIGLGFARGGVDAWAGKTLVAADPARGKQSRVRVDSPHFFDPENLRLRPDCDPEPKAGAEPRPVPETAARISALGTDWGQAIEAGAAGRVIGRDARAGRAVERPDAADGDAAVWLVEPRPEPIWRLAAWPEAAGDAKDFAAGLADGATRVYRLGPLDWRAHGPGAGAFKDCPPALGAALDLSHALARIRIGGVEAEALLNRFLAIDLSPRALPVGSAAATGFEHVPVSLARIDAQAFDLWAPRSYALWLWDGMAEVAERLG